MYQHAFDFPRNHLCSTTTQQRCTPRQEKKGMPPIAVRCFRTYLVAPENNLEVFQKSREYHPVPPEGDELKHRPQLRSQAFRIFLALRDRPRLLSRTIKAGVMIERHEFLSDTLNRGGRATTAVLESQDRTENSILLSRTPTLVEA